MIMYMSNNQREAFRAFQTLIPTCRRHGSTVYGLSTPTSDVDVCIEDSHLEGLPDRIIRSNLQHARADVFEQNAIVIKRYLLHLRIPRLVLEHIATGVHIDVVGMGCYEIEKDHAMSCLCKYPTIRDFLTMVRNWWKSFELDPADGFPNTLNMLLMATSFLQLYMGIPVWNILVAGSLTQSQLDPFSEYTSIDLFGNFLCFLEEKRYSCAIRMDLKKGIWQPKYEGRSLRTWHLIDPCNNRNVFSGFGPDLVHHVIERVSEHLTEFLQHYPECKLFV